MYDKTCFVTHLENIVCSGAAYLRELYKMCIRNQMARHIRNQNNCHYNIVFPLHCNFIFLKKRINTSSQQRYNNAK